MFVFHILSHPNISTANNKHRVAPLIVHELAHQWFGNLDTMKWWTDLRLNEGFATYIASLGVEYLHPGWHSLEEEFVVNMLGIFKFDALTSSHPVSAEIAYLNQSDLWVAQTEEARINKVLSDDVDVKTVMESWTLQTGYPGITVTRNYE